MKHSLLAICILAAISGCATKLPVDDRSPEQISASVKDKGMTGICTRVNSPWGVGVVVQFSIDTKVVNNGAVSVTDQCSMTFSNSPTPAKSASGV